MMRMGEPPRVVAGNEPSLGRRGPRPVPSVSPALVSRLSEEETARAVATPRLEFRILGPLAVLADGEPVSIGGPKQRALLALLLLSSNRVVSRDRLVGELFADLSPNSADHALRNQISRLRKVLSATGVDPPRLVAQPPGYLLRVEPEELDLEDFEGLFAEGREALAGGRPTAAAPATQAADRRRQPGHSRRPRLSGAARRWPTSSRRGSPGSRQSAWRSSGLPRSSSGSTQTSRSAATSVS